MFCPPWKGSRADLSPTLLQSCSALNYLAVGLLKPVKRANYRWAYSVTDLQELSHLMEHIRRFEGQPQEITALDARIARAGGTTSTLETLPHRLRDRKNDSAQSVAVKLETLTQENGYLRQEIVYYQESRNAMMNFHNQAFKSFKSLKLALQELSQRMALSESNLLKYWGIKSEDEDEEDLVVI